MATFGTSGFILSEMESLEGFEQRDDKFRHPFWGLGSWSIPNG